MRGKRQECCRRSRGSSHLEPWICVSFLLFSFRIFVERSDPRDCESRGSRASFSTASLWRNRDYDSPSRWNAAVARIIPITQAQTMAIPSKKSLNAGLGTRRPTSASTMPADPAIKLPRTPVSIQEGYVNTKGTTARRDPKATLSRLLLSLLVSIYTILGEPPTWAG